ncbi:MAG: hypothetical protein AAGA58_09530 [Verrucomicrobiota bacterium]
MKKSPLFTLLFLPALAFAAPSVTTIAGTGKKGHDPGGKPATETAIDNPFGIVRGPDGLLYFCEYEGECIRRIEMDGTTTVIAGQPGKTGYSGDGGLANEATMNRPHEIRFDSKGRLYVADTSNHVVRRIANGKIETVAGIGEAGFSGDGGPATSAKLKSPISIQLDKDDNLYICDIGNHRVRVVSKEGTITTLAGNGKRELPEDGAAFAKQPLKGPRTIDFDENGDLWVVLREGNSVYRFDMKLNTLHHVAGTGKKGFTGNGGPAKAATLSGPKGVSVAPNGNIYLADTESHSIRMIDLSKTPPTMELICGTGEKKDGPDGNPKNCGLARPHGVFIDADGTIFIGDSSNHRVRKITESP